jgi:putative acetyltransferase
MEGEQPRAHERWKWQASIVKHRELLPVGAPSMSMRLVRFQDVSGILRLIERALEHGCRGVYDARQRRSVYLGYASTLFIEALGPFVTLVAEIDGHLVGTAQIDPRIGLLRALFVDAGFQGQGVGRALLGAIEARARAAGCERLSGAMSLNAVEFYRRAGFRPRREPLRLQEGPIWVPVLWMDKPLRTHDLVGAS